MSRILVLDDDPHILRTMEILLQDDGHDVLSAKSGEAALAMLEHETVEIAFIDLQLPGMHGNEFLRKLRDTHRHIEAIIITAHGSIETAVEAMKEGAFDYLTKPFSPQQVRHRLRQIERISDLRTQVAGLRRRLSETPYNNEFITQNPTTRHVLEMACGSVATSDATVLITGESGTGKTLLAKLIHQSSHRREGQFVTVDCTSFQESLLESELFGHKRGAFTGAVADKVGKVETAQGGTLFLDEIGEVALHLQGKLLRLVEEHSYECVGDPKLRTIDARIIAAGNRDLEEMVKEKAFREDLFFRLSVVDLHVPALRHRTEDIPLIAREMLFSFSRAHGKKVTGWDNEVDQSLLRYAWPGNIRELAHIIERAVLVCPGRTLRMEHMPKRFIESENLVDNVGPVPTLAELEEQYIRKTLALGLSLEESAKRLGIDPSTLWRKRKKYDI